MALERKSGNRRRRYVHSKAPCDRSDQPIRLTCSEHFIGPPARFLSRASVCDLPHTFTHSPAQGLYTERAAASRRGVQLARHNPVAALDSGDLPARAPQLRFVASRSPLVLERKPRAQYAVRQHRQTGQAGQCGGCCTGAEAGACADCGSPNTRSNAQVNTTV